MALGGQGPDLVLVHGLGGSAEDWYGPAAHLAGRFRCLIPCLPGFGYSSLPDAPQDQPFFLAALLEMADLMGLERPHWAGHSMGGQIVLGLGLDRPERCDRLVAVCPAGGHRTDRPWWRVLRRLLDLVPDQAPARYPAGLLPALVWWLFGEPAPGAKAEAAGRYRRLWRSPDVNLRARALTRSARGVLAQPLWRRLPELEPPLLMALAVRDRVVPRRDSAALVEHLPVGARLVWLPGGHLPVYTRPGVLARLLADHLETPR